jgi:hypothetical protein
MKTIQRNERTKSQYTPSYNKSSSEKDSFKKSLGLIELDQSDTLVDKVEAMLGDIYFENKSFADVLSHKQD